jgi:integrase
MAYIEERKTKTGEIRFKAQIRIKGYPTQTQSFRRKTDAQRWSTQTEAAIMEGRHFKKSESKKHTFAELADRYEKIIMPGKERCKQEGQLRWWKEQIGHYTLADITSTLIVEHRDKLAAGITRMGTKLAPGTVTRYLAILSHVFTIAVNDWGWVDDSPMRKVTKPKQRRGRVRFLDDDERARLLTACRTSDKPYLYRIVVLALSTGMRKGEMMNLRWKDVDLEKQRIILHETKNNEIRVVPLTGTALKLLIDLAKEGSIETDYLFPSEREKNRPMDIRFTWEKALEQANISDFRFHDLRHSAASYLAMNGASLNEIADVLGHKTIQMSKRYAHLSEAHTQGVVERMNERFMS